MKKVYFDAAAEQDCIGIIRSDAEIVPSGTTVHAMSVRDKNAEYQRYADAYDIHFIFDDDVPAVGFFTVPYIRIFAYDSRGGYLGFLWQENGEEPVCYIDRERKAFLAAQSVMDLWNHPARWKEHLTPCDGVTVYPSKTAAAEKLEFMAIPETQPKFPDDFRQIHRDK